MKQMNDSVLNYEAEAELKYFFCDTDIHPGDIYYIACDWLPPYSLDKNKIERLWANMKNWLRIKAQNFPTIQQLLPIILNRIVVKNQLTLGRKM